MTHSEKLDLEEIREFYGSERDESGHFIGCYFSGCKATRCRVLCRIWADGVELGDINPPVKSWSVLRDND